MLSSRCVFTHIYPDLTGHVRFVIFTFVTVKVRSGMWFILPDIRTVVSDEPYTSAILGLNQFLKVLAGSFYRNIGIYLLDYMLSRSSRSCHLQYNNNNNNNNNNGHYNINKSLVSKVVRISKLVRKLPSCVRVQLKCDGTRWRTGGEVKGKMANGVGSQYPSHYLGTWCIQHYYRCCTNLGCQ